MQNISIFHYHLNPGGVTRIIESQVAGFKEKYPEAKLQVFTGHCENVHYYSELGIEVHVNEKLNYLADKDYTLHEIKLLFEELYNWILERIQKDEVLHVHNLNLGKNPVFTLVVEKFLKKGYKLINHAHDFAEDRPANLAFLQKIIGGYFKKELMATLYPKNKNYLVGVLNQFDFDRVIKYGVEEQRVFLWPNPVSIFEKKSISKIQDRQKLIELFNIPFHHKILTYPVRVIQRKNIGELILLSYLFSDSCTFMVTMAPKNPIETQFYNDWKNFCAENKIPLIFEAGEKVPFETIVSGSDYCITTSIKEGFGMAYLEPWAMGTPVIGRNIEYVTSDIKKAGVRFPLLYTELMVPFYNQLVDFKDLNFDRQQAFILSLVQGVVKKESIFEINSFLTSFPPRITKEAILANKKVIKQEFSLEKYAERIFNGYKTFY